MTEKAMGQSMQWFTGTVVSRDDPTQVGRVQVRVNGAHDDRGQIPDKDLYWAHIQMTPTSSSFNQVGSSPTGLQVGSRIFGYFADRDKQILVVTGTMHAASNNATSSQSSSSQSGEGNDVYQGARDEKTQGKDENPVTKKNVIKHAEEGMQHPKKKTIGYEDVKDFPNVLQAIKTLDPQNLSGVIKNAVQGHINLKGVIGALGGLQNLAKLTSNPTELLSQIGRAPGGQQIMQVIQNPANGLSTTGLQIAKLQQISQSPQMLQQVLGRMEGGQQAIDHLGSTMGLPSVVSVLQDELGEKGNQDRSQSGEIDQEIAVTQKLLQSMGSLGNFSQMIEGALGEVEKHFDKTFSSS